MRFGISLSLILLLSLVFAQGRDEESIGALIKKLGSANFQDRRAATEALKNRPEAVLELRRALQSLDLETRRRAAEILDHLALRELDLAVKEGRVQRVTELVADWPATKHEEEVWHAVGDLTRALSDLQRKKTHKATNVMALWANPSPAQICEKRITENTKTGNELAFFLRAGEVDLVYSRLKGGKPPNMFLRSDLVVVSAQSVRLFAEQGTNVVFAGGSVEFAGSANGALIVSAGDVILEGIQFSNCLVIARGNVFCKGNGYLKSSYLISGKSVVSNKKHVRDCIVTENDPNPLGFVRWSERANEKATPKSKLPEWPRP
jgi:hypothetical protein